MKEYDPTLEDLVILGHLKPEDLRQGMSTFKEDAIVEEEIERLNLELTEKYDAKPSFAW